MNQTKRCAGRRIAAMLLSLVMLVSMLPTAAFAAAAPDYKFGTAQTVLTPGKYDLPVSLMNASKPGKPSMAASCIKGGELDVMRDGSAALTVKLGPVSMMGITAWGKDWKVYSKYDLTSPVTPAEVVSQDKDGHVTAIRFQLPYTDQDGVYIQMIAMGTNPSEALLAMDFAAANKIGEPEPAAEFPFGSAQTMLKPGVYELPVSLMNASNPEKPSMAADCIQGGTLEVMEDGTAFVNVKLGVKKMGAMEGWSSKWEVYNAHDTGSAVTPAQVVAKDAAGHETEIRFQLPYTDQDGVYVKMYVEVVNMNPDGYLAMDFASLVGGSKPEPQPQPEVKNGSADVAFGPEKAYGVTAAVSVLDGKITGVELNHDAAASGHENSVSYADNAKAMAAKFTGLATNDKTAIEAVDVVSGATVTSNAYKEAVLKALGLYVAPKPADFTFGSANTELKPGEYQVPVSLRNAGKHESSSMAAGAFPALATLTVAEDGTATLTTNMQAVTVADIQDMAHSVLIYQEDNFLTEKTVAATVLETVKKPEPMPGAGKDVPTKISFEIPNNDWDGVYLNFTVDAMGPGYPDGWLKIDYARAGAPGSAVTYPGSAGVDQFGKYTIHTDVSVKDGVITNVAVSADNFISETHRPTNEMKIAQVTEALKSAWNGMEPTQANAEEIFYKIMKPENRDEVIDTVSGATYSAKAVRDAVMNAFGLEYQDEIINVPEKVEPGVYQVEIGYYSDVVWHSLVENTKTLAQLTVNADGTMFLDFETKSGTEKEPLYILGFNGVYENNDRAGKLTIDGSKVDMGLSSNDYEDEFFAKGTQVVNHLTIPLLGGLDKVYNTNCRMYVPAMKRLNGELSGIYFENGTFNADVFAKVYWDTMKPEQPGQVVKTGTVDVDMLVSGKDKPSMCDVMFGRQAGVRILDNGMAELELLVANPIPGYPDQGKDGTLKDFTVTYQGKQYVAESQLGTGRMMTAKANNPMFGLVAGQEYPAQVLTVTLPESALNETKLATSAYVNVVMNRVQDFDIKLSNLILENIPEPVAPDAPVILPQSGEFTDSVTVTINAQAGAEIYYSINGAERVKYTEPFVLTETAQVEAVAVMNGLESSAVTASFTRKAAVKPVLPEGSYYVPVVSLTSGAPLPPVQEAFSKAFGQEIRLDVTADGQMTATIVPQHMVVDMAAMGAYHCNVLTVEGASYPEMKTELVTPKFGMADQTQKIECPAVIVVPMPKANEKGGYVFTLTVDFMNSFLGGGLDKPYPTDVTLTLDFDNARKIEEVPQQKIEDGNYYVELGLWHASKDQASMGDVALDNNRKVLVTVTDGQVVRVQAATNPVQMAGFVSAVIAMEVDGKPVDVQEYGLMFTHTGNQYDYLKLFSFEMPEASRPTELSGVTYAPVSFVVPDTPMGPDPIDARLRFDWSTAQKTEDTQLVPNGDTSADNKPVELLHEQTGIKLNSNTLVVSDLAQLAVDKITSGEAYDAAVKAMADLKGWELYHIATLLKGQETAPKGQVTLSIPCGPEGLEIYRINDNGSKVKLVGEVQNGYYVVKTSKLGNFAIIGHVGQPEVHFVDVPENHWGRDFIYKSVELNIFAGYDATHFGPDDEMNRAMFVTVLGKMAGVDVNTAEKSGYSDVDQDAYYAPYVAWAEKAGITAGVGGNRFAPEDPVTREQMAIFLVKYCNYKGIELKNGDDLVFADDDEISGYAMDYVALAVRGGLMAGIDGGKFGPQLVATRAQAATVLVKLVQNYSL